MKNVITENVTSFKPCEWTSGQVKLIPLKEYFRVSPYNQTKEFIPYK